MTEANTLGFNKRRYDFNLAQGIFARTVQRIMKDKQSDVAHALEAPRCLCRSLPRVLRHTKMSPHGTNHSHIARNPGCPSACYSRSTSMSLGALGNGAREASAC